MASKNKARRARLSPEAAAPMIPKELKIALLVAIPFAALAALVLGWSRWFPVPPERLVEVVWRHDCACASNWMKGLRAEGFVVRDFELDDLSSSRKQWQVPASIDGCHPGHYMGYFLDGHLTPAVLRRLALERPKGIGLQKRDTVKPDAEGKLQIVSSQLMLIDASGAATVWPEPPANEGGPEPSTLK
ncbi:MAG: hypothetical protein EPN60_09880 [Nevskiaceae bacterium]|nr:DUF411 domain-containing protein [Stagnimonas sp.]TAM26564.1 MAG: hypothetical protein EPN60_09880 [Nevskiaceae bacterium]